MRTSLLIWVIFLGFLPIPKTTHAAKARRNKKEVPHQKTLERNDSFYFEQVEQCRDPSVKDQRVLSEFFTKRDLLFDSYPDEFERIRAYDRLFDETYAKLSDVARVKLSETVLRFKTESLIQEMKLNPEIGPAFARFEQILQEHVDLREKGTHWVGGKLSKSARAVMKEGENLKAVISTSGLPESSKREIQLAIHQSIGILLNKDLNLIEDLSRFWEGSAATFKGIRNTAVGLGLIIGGLYLGGTTVKGGGALLAAQGTKAAAYVYAALTAAAAGAAGGAGYALVSTELEAFGNSLASEGNYFCRMAIEQSVADQEALRRSLQYARVGAAVGAAFGLGMAPGGVSAKITTGLAGVATTSGAAISIWGVGEEGLQARHHYELAQTLALEGNEEQARRQIDLARQSAVKAGLKGIDAALATIGAVYSWNGFRAALKTPPESILEAGVVKSGRTEVAAVDGDLANGFRSATQNKDTAVMEVFNIGRDPKSIAVGSAVNGRLPAKDTQ